VIDGLSSGGGGLEKKSALVSPLIKATSLKRIFEGMSSSAIEKRSSGEVLLWKDKISERLRVLWPLRNSFWR